MRQRAFATLFVALAFLQSGCGEETAESTATETSVPSPPRTFLSGSSPWSITWSPDGKRLASGGRKVLFPKGSQDIELWDAKNNPVALGTPMLQQKYPLKSNPAPLVSTGGLPDLYHAVQDILYPLEGSRHPSHGILDLEWSPDGKKLACCDTYEKKVKVWDSTDGKFVLLLKRQLNERTQHFHPYWSLPQGRQNNPSFPPYSYYSIPLRQNKEALSHLQKVDLDAEEFIGSVSWSPDSKKLVGGSSQGKVRIWDASSGREIHTLDAHSQDVNSVAWSPDGMRVASASGDKTVRIWDALNGSPLHSLDGHSQEVTSVSWSPDGTKLVSGSYDTTLRIWDTKDGRELSTLRGHIGGVYSVAWSPAGDVLASSAITPERWASGKRVAGEIKLWDPSVGKELATLKGQTDVARKITWSPDGAALAAACYDRTIRIWQVAR